VPVLSRGWCLLQFIVYSFLCLAFCFSFMSAAFGRDVTHKLITSLIPASSPLSTAAETIVTKRTIKGPRSAFTLENVVSEILTPIPYDSTSPLKVAQLCISFHFCIVPSLFTPGVLGVFLLSFHALLRGEFFAFAGKTRDSCILCVACRNGFRRKSRTPC